MNDLQKLADIFFGLIQEEVAENCKEPWAIREDERNSRSRFVCNRIGNTLYIQDDDGKEYTLTLEEGHAIIDLSKLTPGQFRSVGCELYFTDKQHMQLPFEELAAFVALAGQAFDVMMRRGWFPFEQFPGLWSVGWLHIRGPFDAGLSEFLGSIGPEDPFTALVEADRFMAGKEKANG